MQVGELTAFLRLDRSEFEGGLDSAGGKARGFGGRIAKAAKVGTAAVAAAGAAAAAGAFKVAAYGDELDKSSSKLGVHATVHPALAGAAR